MAAATEPTTHHATPASRCQSSTANVAVLTAHFVVSLMLAITACALLPGGGRACVASGMATAAVLVLLVADALLLVLLLPPFSPTGLDAPWVELGGCVAQSSPPCGGCRGGAAPPRLPLPAARLPPSLRLPD